MTQAANSIVNGRGLVGKISVPMTLFPFAVVQEGLYRQASVFVLLTVLLLSDGYPITETWLYLAPLLLVYYIMIVACSFIGACMVCVARDYNQVISLGVMFLLFMSGIFWDVRTIADPEKAALVMNFNPLAFILDAFRQIMMYNTPPDMLHLATIGTGFGALICAMTLIMRRSSHYLALKALTA